MNNIDKALLIKELKELSINLEENTLSFFEKARTKQRIKDILAHYDASFEEYVPEEFRHYIDGNSENNGLSSSILEQSLIDPLDFPLFSMNEIIAEPQIQISNEIAPPPVINNPAPIINPTPIVVEPVVTAALNHLTINQKEYFVKEIKIHRTEKRLYKLILSEDEGIDFHEILILGEDLRSIFGTNCYLAEKITSQGYFSKYLVLLGAESQTEAMQYLQAYANHLQHELAALKLAELDTTLSHLFDFDKLFSFYTQLEKFVWHKTAYFAFMPKHIALVKKLIPFEETEANIETPLVLLKDRNRIYVIHGENRLAIQDNALAYPHILFDRQKGMSWQIVKEQISMLSHSAISPTQLIENLQDRLP